MWGTLSRSHILFLPSSISSPLNNMNQEEIDFLLRYAKAGILSTMQDLDPIASEELKQEYIRIKQGLMVKQEHPSSPQKTQGDKKPSAVKKWLSGIGARQRKYQDEHKGDLI